jgi:hypothetical protein
MNIAKKTTSIDRKVLLSTIWIFATFSYLYCDVVSLMDSNTLKQYLTGTVNGMVFNQGHLLAAGILMEIPIVMVLFSRVLKYKANRWVNIIAGAIMTVVQTLTLLFGKPALYYLFFSIIEIASTAMIIWFAVKWRNLEGLS